MVFCKDCKYFYPNSGYCRRPVFSYVYGETPLDRLAILEREEFKTNFALKKLIKEGNPCSPEGVFFKAKE